MVKNKKGLGLLLSVAFLLPVILYVVYFWRSGVFSDTSDLSAMFSPGSFSQKRTLVEPVVDIPERTVAGVTYTYDAATYTWYLSGVCTEQKTVNMGRVLNDTIPGYLFLSFDYSSELTGCFYTSFNIVPVVGSTTYSYYPTQGEVVFYQVQTGAGLLFNLSLYPDVDYTGTYFRVQSSFCVASDDFHDFQVVNHTAGSFGEFLCNNFSIHELNCIVSEPVIMAIGTANGEVSPASAYVVYVISAYTVYIMMIFVVLLIVKVITFVPCVIIRFIDKIGGGG